MNCTPQRGGFLSGKPKGEGRKTDHGSTGKGSGDRPIYPWILRSFTRHPQRARAILHQSNAMTTQEKPLRRIPKGKAVMKKNFRHRQDRAGRAEVGQPVNRWKKHQLHPLLGQIP